MGENQNRRSIIVCGYFLSRMDRKGLELLGCESFTEAFKEMGRIISANPNTIKNRRDDYDAFFPNNRVGWQNRQILALSKEILEELNHYSDEELFRYVHQLLFGDEAERLSDKGLEANSATVGVQKVLVRRGQAKFHEMVLAAYHQRCCMTGLAVPDLLQAAHIKSWESADPVERRDPCNGLCLNPLHHLAFDQGYLTVDRNRQIRVATEFRRRARTDGDRLVADCEGRSIILPDRYLPSLEFLEWHQDTVFLG